MTSKLPDSSGDKSHKVIVKGKYLAAIEKYVSTLVLGQGFLVKWNPEFEALQKVIVGLPGHFLSENNVASIVIEKCLEFRNAHLDRTGTLSDPKNSDLRESLVGLIKEYLESLPRKYTLRIGLASFPRWGAAKYEISRSIRIVIDDPLLTGKNVLAQFIAGHEGIVPPTYIEFSASGYSDWSPDSPAASDCLSLAKQCAFILTSYGICKSNFSQNKATATLTDDGTNTLGKIVLPDAMARCFGNLIPNEEKLLVDDNNGMTIISTPGRPAATNEEKSMAFGGMLYHATRFFETQNHPDFESIAVAIEWHQDSIFADNQTFSYLAACIGLEALFGSDSHLENMSKRLADRYAFLLGKSRKEREKMIAEYTSVLNLRGRLVHSKAARLSGENVSLLYTAQRMLINSIWHELYAMYKAKDEQRHA